MLCYLDQLVLYFFKFGFKVIHLKILRIFVNLNFIENHSHFDQQIEPNHLIIHLLTFVVNSLHEKLILVYSIILLHFKKLKHLKS